MRLPGALVLSVSLAGSPAVLAVDFGVMETAIPIENGHVKYTGFPLAIRKAAESEQDMGVTVGLGYGISERWDAELQLATYDDITFVGADLEHTFLDRGPLSMSLTAGAHYANLDFGTQRGVDLTYIASYALTSGSGGRKGSGFTLNTALDLARDERDLDRPTAGFQDRYSSVHLVPGLQYRVSLQVDIMGEIGVGLNDASDDYVAIGTSYYFVER